MLRIHHREAIYCFLIAVFATLNLQAATYYVSTNGNDSYNGTSVSTPWKTIAKVNAQTLLPGDKVLFQAGGIWREELELKPGSTGYGNRVYYGRYDSGVNPKILGSNIATTWTTTAYPNIWQSATVLSNPRTGDWGYPGETYFVTNDSTSWGDYQSYTSNFSNLNSEFDWTWNSNIMYVYSPTDPDTRYDQVEAVQRDVCVGFVNDRSSYIEFNGIDLHYSRRAGYANQSYPQADNQTDVTIRNCNIGYIGEKGGACAYGIEAFHSNFLVENCTITDCGRRGISFNLYEPDVNPALTLSNIIIRNNVFKRGYHTTSLDIATDAQEPGHSMENIYFYGNLIDDHEVTMTGEDAGSNQLYFQPYDSYFNNFYVFNNVFIAATLRNILITGGDNVYIHNNTIFSHNQNITASPYGNISVVRDVTARISNNIIYDDLPANTAIDNWCILSYATTGDPVTFESLDYNLYYHLVQNDGDRGIMGSNHFGYYQMNDWSTFRTDYPAFEANSPIPAEPLFTDKKNYDLTLTENSPAAGAGLVLPYFIVTDAHGRTDTINKYDFAGNIRSRTSPSIGAFEYLPPDTILLQNKQFSIGNIDCFDASQTITTAGNGTTFVLEDGGKVDLIAGQNIIMLPGTHAHEGSYLYAAITADNTYCIGREPLIPPTPVLKSMAVNAGITSRDTRKACPEKTFSRVYPNPTKGQFTLDLYGLNSHEKVEVTIYGVRGERIQQKNVSGNTHHLFSLEGQLPGVYMVQVRISNKVDVRRIIKQ
jgi:hypothetical protein